MLSPFENNLPRRIRFGRGISFELPAELLRLGKSRPFVVTDMGVRKAGLLAGVVESFAAAGAPCGVFDQTEPEPPFSSVAKAVESVRRAGDVDVIIALGGGSVIDTAKLVAATAKDGREAHLLAGIGKVLRRSLPLVCLPTTSGTGSEVTPVAIFTNPDTGTKVGVVDPCLVPDVVLLDPALTDLLPALPTAAAGMDALVHALEAYIATIASPLARGLAIEAARHIGPALPVVCRDGSNRAARDSMLLGANLAGLAFANSSCCAVHALALPLGGRFHIAHGIVTGTLCAPTMRHNLPSIREDARRFASALGWEDTEPDHFPDQIAALTEDIGLARALSATSVPDSALLELARDAVANRRLMGPNPRAISEIEAVAIYRQTLRSHG